MGHLQSLKRLVLRTGNSVTRETKGTWTALSWTASSPRLYHSSRFSQKSSEEIAQSKELHKQMKEVMGAKSAPATTEADNARKARFRQSAINVGVSFMTVVLAGQALKSGSERRKMEKKMYEAMEETEEKIKLLKNLSSEAVVRGLAQKVSNEIGVGTPSVSDGSSQSWFRRQPSDASPDPSTEERVYRVLRTELSFLVGDADQSAAERDRSNLEKLQQEEMAMAEQLLKEQCATNQKVRVERVGDGETVIKKSVFRM